MQTIDDAYTFIKLIANKNNQGFLSPGQFNQAWQASEAEQFNEYVGLPEQYQPGRPVPLVAYGMTRTVDERLDPFVKRVRFVPTASVPFWTKPANFVHLLALVAEHVPTAAEPSPVVDVEEVAHAELGGRLSHSFLFPSLDHPIATFGAGQMEVYPSGLPAVTVTYLGYPVPGQWVGTVVAGRLVYDPVASVQPQWPRTVWNNLCVRTLRLLGINLKAQDLVQYTEMLKQQGL